MHNRSIAQIALRVVSLFLTWRSVEFGISNFVGVRYQMKILTPPTSPEMSDAFRSMENVTMISTLIPLILAVLLWILAPQLSRFMVAQGDTAPIPPDSNSLRRMLLQTAGLVFVGLAAVMLPDILFGFYTDRQSHPEPTFLNSRAFTYMTQFFGKLIVGAAMILTSRHVGRSDIQTRTEQGTSPNRA